MGTFSITIPTTASTTNPGNPGWEGILDNSGSQADLLYGLINAAIYFSAPQSGLHASVSFGFTLIDNIISLDGNSPTSFYGLPPGFAILSAELDISVFTSTLSPTVFSGGKITAGGDFVNLPTNTDGNNDGVQTYHYPQDITILDLLENGFSLSGTLTGPITGGSIYWYGFSITGTYGIQFQQYQLQNPNDPIYPGDKVAINNTGGPGGLDGVSQIWLYYTDPVNGPRILVINTGNVVPNYVIATPVFGPGGVIASYINPVVVSWTNLVIIQELYQLLFYLPALPGILQPLQVAIILIGDGTQFSGSVNLGALTVLFADTSGIYVLTEDQTSDILYFRNGYTTNSNLIMLDLSDETYQDDLYSLLKYPYKILSQNDTNEDFEPEESYFSIISTPYIATSPRSVEIPSPYIKTAFLP